VNRKAIWFRRVIKAKQLFDSAIIFLVAPIVNSDYQKNGHQQGGLPVWFFRTGRDKLKAGIH